MCGIVAAISVDGGKLDEAIPNLEGSLDGALDRIKHRGPDGRGIWVSDDRTVALAHCRLSINDLTHSGSQPLHTATGVHAVVNGELYDYDRLRAMLEARSYAFASRSDSELVLYLYEEFGLGFTEHLRGEFAIVLHDDREGRKETVVLRDRFGIKPMFVRRAPGGALGGVVMVAAEMKAFLDLGWEPEWNVRAIADGGWGQDTRTIFAGVEKLRPGHLMHIKDGKVETRAYWDASYPDKTTREPRTESEMVERTRDLLLESVAHRLRADVPVGIYLSGGIDSSALAGIADYLVRERGLSMGKQSHSDKICCFSIAFDTESGFDESDISRRTADHLGVRFITQHMDEQALADRFEEAVYSCEHHNHDLNFVGKHALSELPREHGYKVVLTGEGADEHFGGYPLYLPDFLSAEDVNAAGPDGLREEERERIREDKVGQTVQAYEMAGADASYILQHAKRQDKGENTKGHLPLYTPGAMLAFLPSSTILSHSALSHLGQLDPLQMIADNISTAPHVRDHIENKWHPLNSAMYVWSKGHLANQFLSCLGDRVEMAHSVEARTPFLDHVLAEHVNGLPVGMKVKTVRSAQASSSVVENGHTGVKDSEDGTSIVDKSRGEHVNGDLTPSVEFIEKYALREAVRPFVTEEVYTRRKHAYTAPTTYPANGPVNRLLDRLVTRERVERLGWVSWDVVEHLKKRAWAADQEEKQDAEGKEQDVMAWRQVLMVAEWTVLAERFGVKTWSAPN